MKEVRMDRNNILQNIQRNKIEPIALPKPFNPLKKRINKLNLFKEMIKQTGGDCIEVNSTEQLNIFLGEYFSSATDFRKKEIFEKYPISCPKEKLTLLKTVIIDGLFGVAENGSIWINDSNFPNRLIPFITEELVLCLNSKQTVSDMHDAYFKLKNTIIGFGVFISGPSKTSDIEQHLVYGAHGAKKLIVLLLSD